MVLQTAPVIAIVAHNNLLYNSWREFNHAAEGGRGLLCCPPHCVRNGADACKEDRERCRACELNGMGRAGPGAAWASG